MISAYVVSCGGGVCASSLLVAGSAVRLVCGASCLGVNTRLPRGVRILLVSCEPLVVGGFRICWVGCLGGSGFRVLRSVAGLRAGCVVGDVREVVLRRWCGRGLYYVGCVLCGVLFRSGARVFCELRLYDVGRVLPARAMQVHSVSAWVMLPPARLCVFRQSFRGVLVCPGLCGCGLSELCTIYGTIVVFDGGLSLRGVRDMEAVIRLIDSCSGGGGGVSPVLHTYTGSFCVGHRVDLASVEASVVGMRPPSCVRLIARTEDDVSVCHVRVVDVAAYLVALLPSSCHCLFAGRSVGNASYTVTVYSTGVVAVRVYWRGSVSKPVWGDLDCVCVCGRGEYLRGDDYVRKVCETIGFATWALL
jgi:hypothetical protein